jgi:hypothetical protein
MRLRYLVFAGAAGLLAVASLEVTGCETGTFERHVAYRADGGPGTDACSALDEICDGVDNDCDGLVDNDDPSLTANDVRNCGQCGRVCDLPNVDIHTCIDGECGISKCDEGYSDLNETASDGCESDCVKTLDWDPCDGEDNDCNGVVDDGYDLQSDPNNCGACGFVCADEHPEAQYHVLSFGCSGGQCAIAACSPDWYDRDGVMDDGQGNLGCEDQCVVSSTVELCNGVDDDCDGQVDNNPVGAPACLDQGVCAGVTATCDPQVGSWECVYPSTYQQTEDDANPPGCDGLDNDCDGQVDEGFLVGQTCYVGQGACRQAGSWICNAQGSDAECTAVAGTPQAEVCDGEDNDCDGLVDEYQHEDGNGNYVEPAVVAIGGGVYMFAYEASRPNATAVTAGTGNGYHCTSCGGGVPAAPSGVPLEGTRACSVPGRLPWFNVSPVEAEQTCQAIGGRVCDVGEWQAGCQAGSGCTWGYGSSCNTAANYSTRYCNLGEYDFDSGTSGDQDGLLPTGDLSGVSCYADWGGGDRLYDVTGNLREITRQAADEYPLMGGAFNTGAENGGACDYDFYIVDSSFQLLDTGFRCCFDGNPSP